ncbi:MAG: phage minor head protein [Dehalococcoidia bacterium]|jgi:hypothetical protein
MNTLLTKQSAVGTGEVKPLSPDERLLRKAVARCLKAQVAEVHGKVEGGDKASAVPTSTAKWDAQVVKEIRPIWFGLFKKGGDQALKQIRKFPKHARKMAVFGRGEMAESVGVDVVVKGGPGSGNFGHEGRPGEVGGSGGGGMAMETGDLPLARGALWKDLGNEEYRDSLRDRARMGERIEIVPHLDKLNAIASSDRFVLEEPETVFFGMNGSKFRDMKEGDSFSALGTRSTSNSFERAVRYAGESGAVFEVIVPSGFRAVSASVLGEKETMLLPGSKFEVVGKREGRTQLRMTSDGSDYVKELVSFQNELDALRTSNKSLKAAKPSIVIPDWIEDPDVLDALEREMFRFAEGIDQTTADALRDELMDGMENGETISQLANRISDISDEWVEGWRSEMITRTETARAFTEGHIEAWKSTGVVRRKVWVAAGDACPFCREMDGTVVDLEDSFFDQGDEQTVDWKDQEISMSQDYSDVNGPPLHPNCIVYEDTPITMFAGLKKIKDVKEGDLVLTHRGIFRKVNKTFRHTYTGRVVKIRFGGVAWITVTEDHPVLVNLKWIAAKDIKVGDKVSVTDRQGFVNASVLSVDYSQVKDRTVYNLSVAEDESYIAKGMVVHNCRCVLVAELDEEKMVSQKGGAGSGNFGHLGRPGEVGGSGPGGGISDPSKNEAIDRITAIEKRHQELLQQLDKTVGIEPRMKLQDEIYSLRTEQRFIEGKIADSKKTTEISTTKEQVGWEERLTDSQRGAFAHYLGAPYDSSFPQQVQAADAGRSSTTEAKDVSVRLRSAIDAAPKHTVEVYRGASSSDLPKVGSTFSQDTFKSYSRDVTIARGYGLANVGMTKPYCLVYHVASSSVVDVGRLGAFSVTQKEVLVDKGRSYRVDKVEQDFRYSEAYNVFVKEIK